MIYVHLGICGFFNWHNWSSVSFSGKTHIYFGRNHGVSG